MNKDYDFDVVKKISKEIKIFYDTEKDLWWIEINKDLIISNYNNEEFKNDNS